MYQVTIKGRSLQELKDAVNDINNELGNGNRVVNGVERALTPAVEAIITSTTLNVPKMELSEDEVEVASPYSEAPPLAHAGMVSHIINPPVVDGEGLDAEGLPWDKRINTESKKKIVAGTWKIKRGMDVNVVNQVKAELKQAIHLQANPIAIPAAPIDATTPAVAMVPEVVTPVAPAAPVAPPVMNGGHTLESFRANMPMVMGTLITEGKITPEYVEQLKAHFGTQEIWNVTEEQKEEMFHTFVNHSIIVKVG